MKSIKLNKTKLDELCKTAGFQFWGNEPWKPPLGGIDWSCDYTQELHNLVQQVVKTCAELSDPITRTKIISHFTEK